MTIQKVITVSDLGSGLAVVGNQVVSTAAPTAGDIKAGLQAADHGSWFLLNGRLKSSLPAAAQAAATLLGIGVNLPDATGRIIKQAALLSTGGSASATIAQTNLPAVTLTSDTVGQHTHITDTQGAHTHTEAAGGAHVHNVPTMDNGGTNDASIAQANNTVVNSGLNTGSAGSHAHTINAALGHTHTAGSAGGHGHNVPLGGSGTPISISPPFLGANLFVWLA